MSAALSLHGEGCKAASRTTNSTTFRIHSGGRIYEIDAGSPAEARAIFSRHHGNRIIDKIKANRPVSKSLSLHGEGHAVASRTTKVEPAKLPARGLTPRGP